MTTLEAHARGLPSRFRAGSEVLFAAGVAGLVGAVLLTSLPVLLLLCVGLGGFLLLGALAHCFQIDGPAAFFLVFVLLMISFGRGFSYLHIEAGTLPLYVTELALVTLLVTALRRWLQRRLATYRLWHGPSILLAMYIAVGLARLPFALGPYGREAVRDAVICTYALFAFLAAWLLPSRRGIRLLGGVVVMGSLVASGLIVLNAVRGEGIQTSTFGVLRYGSGIQAFSTTFTALIWAALWATGQLTRRAALGGGALVAGQLVLSVLLVQHRSQLLALVAGLIVIGAANPRWRRFGGFGLGAVIIITLLALLGTLGVLPGHEHPFWQATVERAASSLNPGADSSTEWRVQVNRQVLADALDHPLMGAGFGPPIAFRYSSSDSDDVDPHNSFVAILYRVGVPTAFLLFLSLGLLVQRACRASRAVDQEHLSYLLATLSSLVAMGVFACFNVVLEGPYLGIFFWIPAGVLLRLTVAPGPATQYSRSR